MATESLATECGPMAWDGYDSSVYVEWIEAVSDLMMCGRLTETARTTPQCLGGLIYALTQAMREKLAQEMKGAN